MLLLVVVENLLTLLYWAGVEFGVCQGSEMSLLTLNLSIKVKILMGSRWTTLAIICLTGVSTKAGHGTAGQGNQTNGFHGFNVLATGSDNAVE